MAGEFILRGLHERKKSALEDLMNYGHAQARKTHPGLIENSVMELVRIHRRDRR